MRRTAIALLLLMVSGAVRQQAEAQGSAAYLCSLGPRDGLACSTDDDCPGGVCVLAQGVCDGGADDGLTCSCPGGSCSATPACTGSPSFGTCAGGPFAGDCCDLEFNCGDGRPCVVTHKVCLGGRSQGFPCIRSAQCPESVCGSTGRFCYGVCQSGPRRGALCTSEDDCNGAACSSDYQDVACTQDADCCVAGGGSLCPAGICSAPPVPGTATPTATRRTTGTPTATPTGAAVPTPTRIATPTPRPTGATTPTRLPAGHSVVVRPAAAGERGLAIEDATSFPERGRLEIVLDPVAGRPVVTVGFARTPLSNTLALDTPLPRAVPAGALVRTAPDGTIVYESIAEGAHCALGPRSGPGGAVLLALGVVAAVLRRGRCTRCR